MEKICCIIFFVICGGLIELPEARSAVSVNRFGDITVSNDGTTIRCDRLVCPIGTFRCQVSKVKQDLNANFVERRNVCYSRSNQVLRENTAREPSAPGQNEELNISVMSDGSISSTGVSNIGGGYGAISMGSMSGAMGGVGAGGMGVGYGSEGGFSYGSEGGSYGAAAGVGSGTGGNSFGYGYNSGSAGSGSRRQQQQQQQQRVK